MKVKGREKPGLLSLLFAPDIPYIFCPRHPVYHPVYKEGRKISTAGNQRFWCPGCIIVKGVSYGSFRRKLLVRQYIAAIQVTYCRPSGNVLPPLRQCIAVGHALHFHYSGNVLPPLRYCIHPGYSAGCPWKLPCSYRCCPVYYGKSHLRETGVRDHGSG